MSVRIEDLKAVGGYKTSLPNSSVAVAFLKLKDGSFDGYIPHRFFGFASIIIIVFGVQWAEAGFSLKKILMSDL